MKRQGFTFFPIGFVRTSAKDVPRHWTLSSLEGEIVVYPEYKDGLKGIKPGDRIVVIFCFHKSPQFSKEMLIQCPRHIGVPTGVFNLCSPYRPNPIGLSVLDVLDVKDNVIKVKRLDMIDGTPVLDIKPFKAYEQT